MIIYEVANQDKFWEGLTMLEGISTILFDLNETLLHQNHSEQSRISRTHAKLTQHRPEINLHSFEGAWKKVHRHNAERWKQGQILLRVGQFSAAKEYLREHWYRENIAAILDELDVPYSNHLIEEITGAFQEGWGSGLTIMKEYIGILESLKAKGYKLGIVTNFQQPDLIPNTLERFQLKKFFGSVVISAEVGFRKPHPLLFWRALTQLGIDSPEEAVYVGDNLEEDAKGALLAGLHPVLIEANGKELGSFDGIRRIRSLIDLPAILDPSSNYFVPISSHQSNTPSLKNFQMI